MSVAEFDPKTHILALVSGLPRRFWSRYPIMVLQAFVDESFDKDPFVMAGFVSDVESWLKFTEEWDEMRSYGNRWSALKMSEVAGSGGDISWEKTEFLYRIIEKHIKAAICVVIDLSAVVDELWLPVQLKNPYWLGVKSILNFTAQHQEKLGLSEPINFVFDERSEKEQILQGWFGYVENIPPETRALTGKQPQFENEEEFVPLQAADLYAWWCRKWWRERGREFSATLDYKWQSKRTLIDYQWQSKRNFIRLSAGFEKDDLRHELEKVRQKMNTTSLAYTLSAKSSE
jgi:hypothetical protein